MIERSGTLLAKETEPFLKMLISTESDGLLRILISPDTGSEIRMN